MSSLSFDIIDQEGSWSLIDYTGSPNVEKGAKLSLLHECRFNNNWQHENRDRIIYRFTANPGCIICGECPEERLRTLLVLYNGENSELDRYYLLK